MSCNFFIEWNTVTIRRQPKTISRIAFILLKRLLHHRCVKDLSILRRAPSSFQAMATTEKRLHDFSCSIPPIQKHPQKTIVVTFSIEVKLFEAA
jgi:hypothetical protein